MDLNSIKQNLVNNSRKKRKRVGRGPGSGHGKTATRGHKGHQARSGWSRRLTFEGGQIPLFRKMPIKGFTNGRFKTTYFVINVGQLSVFDDGATVDLEALKKSGLAHVSKTAKIKVLGGGDCEKQLNLKVHAISQSALEKIKQKNGTVEIVK